MTTDNGSTLLLRDGHLLATLEPEEIGGHIIEYLNENPSALQVKKGTVPLSLYANVADYPPEIRERAIESLGEAWNWLEREGLVIQKPFGGGYFITRRGRRLKRRGEVKEYVAAQQLPRALLHPKILQRGWDAVLRGDGETAVFLAFREVEIAVREAAGLSELEVGVALVRKAFGEPNGALADMAEPKPEREALSHLFAGALGRFKNPASHRNVPLERSEVYSALTLASMLLRIVESRSPNASLR